MGHIVGKQCRCRAVVVVWITRNDRSGIELLLAPHEKSAVGPMCGNRIQCRLVRSLIEQLRQRLFFRTPHSDWFAVDDLGNVRLGVVHISNQNRLRRANYDARRFQADVDAMRAEVALLCRMIFGIDEDRIVWARGYAGLATDADRFVEINNAVGALEHCRGGTGAYTWRMRALIAARDLMRASYLWKHTNVNVLYVSTGDRKRHKVFGFAGGRARMTANATRVVDHLGPLHRLVL